jgi:hypothetical protein
MIPFFLLFLGLSSLIGCLGALALGHLISVISASALVIGFGGAWYLSREFKLALQAPSVSLPVFILYALIFIGIYLHSIFLFYPKAGFFWIQDQFNLGDMSFHWGTIRYLGKGATFWPENPIFMGYRFKYPFGMDLFNAFFENLGVGISSHLPLVTLLALLMLFYVLHMAGGPLLVFAIFFSGGIYNFTVPGPWDLGQIQESIEFKNLFLTVLLTQRGFLYAFPAGVFLYRALQEYFSGAWKPSRIEKISIGIIWGALGFFHLHSFFFVSLYLGILILWKKDLKNWFLPIGIAALLGLPFVLNALVPEVGTHSLIHFNARGWARPENSGYLEYWGKNLGPWIVAVISALVVFFRQKKWNSLMPTALAFGLFFIFSHLILAPWDWDNIKLIIWCYTFALMTISGFLWNERSDGVKTFVFLFFIPGLFIFVHSLPLYNHGVQWVSEKELNKAEVLLRGQDVNQGVLIAPAYEHPALLLGYKLYMGYTGHVWSHGYDFTEREALVKRIYEGEDSGVQSLRSERAKDSPKDLPKLVYWGLLEKNLRNGREERLENTVFPPKGLSKVSEALDHELYIIEQK